MNPIIDIGCNLTSSRLYPEIPRILAEARGAGVVQQIITGSDWQSNELGLQLTEHYRELFTTAGFHPHHASQWNPQYHPALLQMICRDERVVAVGEMGLDYFRNLSSALQQQRCFHDQLAVASIVQKPVFLHMRAAFPDFQRILSSYLPSIPKAVWHCFTGTRSELHWALDHGLYIGITGWICDPKRGDNLRDIVPEIPDDRLMIESDAPYLTPKTLLPCPLNNEPKYLPEVLRVVAQCRQQTMSHVAAITTNNAHAFFNIKK